MCVHLLLRMNGLSMHCKHKWASPEHTQPGALSFCPALGVHSPTLQIPEAKPTGLSLLPGSGLGLGPHTAVRESSVPRGSCTGSAFIKGNERNNQSQCTLQAHRWRRRERGSEGTLGLSPLSKDRRVRHALS